MIIDKLENAYKYYNLSDNIKAGLQFLLETDLNNLPCKKHVIDGERIWANVQEIVTKEDETAKWEVHRRYTDIQFVISGCEKMGWANLSDFVPEEAFDTEKDIQFGEIKENCAHGFVVVEQGYFVIFTPDDVHKPALKVDFCNNVKKIVVKVEK